MTLMALEALEAPEAAQRFLDTNAQVITELGQRLRALDPPFIITSARGSSDNAAAYFKYLSEILLGVPCASVGASVASIYSAKLKAKGALALTISQSGKSPDIVALQEEAKRACAFTVALLNTENSPAALGADLCLPLRAGLERSVAATKSFIVSLVAAAAIVAHWIDDAVLKSAVAALPVQLDAATKLPWQGLIDLAVDAESLFVLGRGPSLPIAAESALKFKETCGIHAEAYSTAEVMHGPLELIEANFPVVVFAQSDQSFSSTIQAVERLKSSGARVALAGQGGLTVVSASHPMLEPILMMQSAYLAIEATARARGRDPDRPRLLRKVTETV